jgi:hypothetical protein
MRRRSWPLIYPSDGRSIRSIERGATMPDDPPTALPLRLPDMISGTSVDGLAAAVIQADGQLRFFLPSLPAEVIVGGDGSHMPAWMGKLEPGRACRSPVAGVATTPERTIRQVVAGER